MGKLDEDCVGDGRDQRYWLATATRFVDEGAYVFITRRRDRELAATVHEICKNGAGNPHLRHAISGAAEVAQTFAYFQTHTYLGADAYKDIALANKIAGRQPSTFETWARVNFPAEGA